MIFSFVILHYKTYKDTLQCIKSILELQYDQNITINIVVVDNASNDGSLEKIREFADGLDKLYIIENDKNLGFAKGNNVGYKFARDSLKSDFIAILNNDVIISSKDLITQIIHIYQRDRYHLLGPDIVSLIDGGHQSPAITTSTNIINIKKEILRYRVLLLLNKIGLYDALKCFLSRKKIVTAIPHDTEIDIKFGCQLHGSFIIYSPLYIQSEKFAFYPETFLYGEEAILYQHCIKKNYVIEYNNAIKVYHKEDSSTSFITKTPKKKRDFVFSNIVRSQKVFLDFLNNPEKWA